MLFKINKNWIKNEEKIGLNKTIRACNEINYRLSSKQDYFQDT